MEKNLLALRRVSIKTFMGGNLHLGDSVEYIYS